jgi:hypothetical protein
MNKNKSAISDIDNYNKYKINNIFDKYEQHLQKITIESSSKNNI